MHFSSLNYCKSPFQTTSNANWFCIWISYLKAYINSNQLYNNFRVLVWWNNLSCKTSFIVDLSCIHSTIRASLSMTQASALLIPSPSQTGILTLQDPRSGLIDIGPPSFSPGPGGLIPGPPSSSPSLNFFPQPPASTSTSPRHQPGPQVNITTLFVNCSVVLSPALRPLPKTQHMQQCGSFSVWSWN